VESEPIVVLGSAGGSGFRSESALSVVNPILSRTSSLPGACRTSRPITADRNHPQTWPVPFEFLHLPGESRLSTRGLTSFGARADSVFRYFLDGFDY